MTLCAIVYRKSASFLEPWRHHPAKGVDACDPSRAYTEAHKLKAANPGWTVGVLEGAVIEVKA